MIPVVLVLAAVLVACARPATTASIGASQRSSQSAASTEIDVSTSGVVKLTGPLGDMPYRYLGSVVHKEKWGNTIIVDPPPPGTTSNIDPATLVALCDTQATCGDSDEGPTIQLGLITTPNSGDNGSDGSFIPLMDNALGYELVWQNQVCMPTRQLGQTTAVASTEPATNCTRIAIVNAKTEAYVLSLLL